MKKITYIAPVFLIGLTLSLTFQLATPSLFDDGYFYVKMSELFIQGGLLRDLPWIYYGAPHGDFTGNHFLYWILIAPAMAISRIWGIKIFTALMYGALSAVAHWLFRRLSGSGRAAWVLTVILWIGAGDFFFRMNLNRPLSLSVLLALLIIAGLALRKRRLTIASALLFPLVYEGYILIPLLAAVFDLARTLKTRLFHWHDTAAASLAGIAGLLLHPYFPEVITASHLQYVNPLRYSGILTSNEWMAYPFESIFTPPGGLAALLLVCMLGLTVADRKPRTSEQYALVALAAVFFMASFFSRRFVDFSTPIALIACASLLPGRLPQGLPPNPSGRSWRSEPLLIAPAVVCLGVLFTYTGITINYAATKALTAGSPDKYRGASEYLAATASPGEVVYNIHWDAFPQLFFHNSSQYYASGLNPAFVYARSPERYWLMRHLEADHVLACPAENCDQPRESIPPAQVMRGPLAARYLILETCRAPRLDKYLHRDREFESVYRDRYVAVYKLRHAESPINSKPAP